MAAQRRNQRKHPQSELEYRGGVAKGIPALCALVAIKGIGWGSVVTISLFSPSVSGLKEALAKLFGFLP